MTTPSEVIATERTSGIYHATYDGNMGLIFSAKLVCNQSSSHHILWLDPKSKKFERMCDVNSKYPESHCTYISHNPLDKTERQELFQDIRDNDYLLGISQILKLSKNFS